MGDKDGIATARHGVNQMVVSVSPKAWRPSSGQKHFSAEVSPNSQISLYDRAAANPRRRRRECPRLALARRVETRCRGRAKLGQFHVGSGCAARRSSELAPPLPARDLAFETAGLLRLFQRVDLLHEDSPDLHGSAAGVRPLHGRLLFRRFIDEVRVQLGSARPAYRDVSEARTTIRGRVEPLSVALWQAGATTKLQCRFSELSISTRLLSCIAAALEWIADGRGVRSALPGEFSDLRLRHDAVTVRRVLSEVTAPPAAEALVIARTISLGRLDQAWTVALKLAVDILSRHSNVASDREVRDVDAVELSIPTDKLWERIVTQHWGWLRLGCSPSKQVDGGSLDPIAPVGLAHIPGQRCP